MPKPTLSHLLEQSRTMETDKRLMSESEIHTLLQEADAGIAQPKLTPISLMQRFSIATKAFTFIAAAAAVSFAVFKYPFEGGTDNASNKEIAANAVEKKQEFKSDAIAESSAKMKRGNEMKTVENIASEPKPFNANSEVQYDNERSKVEAHEQKAIITPLVLDNSTSVIVLNAEQFKKLGITLTKNSLYYTERDDIDVMDEARKRGMDGEEARDKLGAEHITALRKVTARTNGIGDIHSNDSTQKAIAPLQITSYINRHVFASYYSAADRALHNTLRRMDENTNVLMPSANSLIPVLATIENANDPVFKKAELILWFEPTNEFIEALPEPYKSALKKEIVQDAVKPKSGEKRYTDTWREEDGAVISSRVYPNPTQDFEVRLAFALSETRTCTIGIMDMFGHTLAIATENKSLEKGEHTLDINLNIIDKNGVYLIVMRTSDGEQIVQRLIVQR